MQCIEDCAESEKQMVVWVQSVVVSDQLLISVILWLLPLPRITRQYMIISYAAYHKSVENQKFQVWFH